MAGSGLGKVFVELDLDDKVFKQKLSEELQSTEATARGMETVWKVMGTRSDAVFDAQRRSYENAMTLIKSSATSTAADIVRAQEAMNAKIQALNEQQFGKQTSLLETLKSGWIAATAIIYGAMQSLNKGWDLALGAAKYEEQTALLNTLAAQYGTTANAIVDSMQKASNGLLSIADATRLATLGMFKNLDPDQLIKVTQAASVLKISLGTDLPTAEEKVINAMTRGRITAADRLFGIQDLDAKLGSLKETTDKHTQAEMVLNAVSEYTTEIQRRMGDQSDSNLSKMEQLTVSWGNFKLQLGEEVLPILVRTIGLFTDLIKLIKEMGTGLGNLTGEDKAKTGMANFFESNAKLAEKIGLSGMAKAEWDRSIRMGGGSSQKEVDAWNAFSGTPITKPIRSPVDNAKAAEEAAKWQAKALAAAAQYRKEDFEIQKTWDALNLSRIDDAHKLGQMTDDTYFALKLDSLRSNYAKEYAILEEEKAFIKKSGAREAATQGSFEAKAAIYAETKAKMHAVDVKEAQIYTNLMKATESEVTAFELQQRGLRIQASQFEYSEKEKISAHALDMNKTYSAQETETDKYHYDQMEMSASEFYQRQQDRLRTELAERMLKSVEI